MRQDPPTSRPRIAPLGSSDLGRLCALHRAIHDSAPEPDLFVVETPEFFSRHLTDDGQVLGAFDARGELVGYGVLGLPQAADPWNFGADIGLAPDERAIVAHLDGSGVAAAWRGLGLHRRLLAARIDLARAHDRQIVLSTVAPRNRWSLANLLAAGLEVVALVRKYDSQRFVLRGDLERMAERAAAVASAGEGPTVPLDDLAGHRAALEAGWRGIALTCDGRDSPAITYAWPKEAEWE